MNTFQRYQYGGDLHAEIARRYGDAAAQSVAAAAATGNQTALNFAISNARQGTSGGPLTESTLAIFGGQVVRDPLGAPLEGLNRTLGNTFLSFLKSPWVLLTLGLFVAWKLGLFNKWLKS